MRRGILIVIATVLLGVALVQDSPEEDGRLEITTEPPQALVTISGPEGFVSMFDVSGQEALTGLGPGHYLIVATAEGHEVARAEVELAAGASESVELRLERLQGGSQAARQDGVQQEDAQGQQQAESQNGQQAQSQDGQQSQQQNGQQSQQQSQQQNGQQAQQQNGQQAQDGQQDQVAGGGQAQQQGAQIYSQQCAQCHGQEGEGGTGPALAGNQNLQDVQMVVGQIVQGGGGMPAFGDQLSDEEIAAVASHELNSWGNDFGQVTADDVAQQTGDGGQAQGGGQQGQQEGQQQAQQQGQQRGQQQGQQQGQQDQQADGQAGQQGQMARVEIEVPADAPVSVNLQIEIGGGADQDGAMGQQADGQDQVAGGGDGADQQQDQQQDQEQVQQPPDQQEDQQEGQQEGQQDGQQSQEDDGQQSQDDVRQGVLQIEWVEPAGATVTVTGPDGFSQQMQVIGGEVLEGLTPGTYTVTGALAGFESAGEEVEVEAQETANVSLTLQQQAGQQQPELDEPGEQQQDGQPDQQQDGQQQQEQDQQQQDGQQAQQQNGQQQDQVAGGGQAGQQGEQIYSQQCAQCHGQEGEGGTGPALAGNQMMQDAQAVVTQIIQGGGGMPAFGNQLSDEEIAAVATHEMNSWGNQFGEVTADDVSQQRNGGGGQQGQQQDGQQGGQSQQGVFTSQQARVGMQEYTAHCAVCHGGGLNGRASYPPVAGDDFLSEWRGRSVQELFDYISTEMPQDRPGTLGHLTYTNITAYILDQNGFAAGDSELRPESGALAQVIIQAPAAADGGEQEGQPPAPVGQETQDQPEQESQ